MTNPKHITTTSTLTELVVNTLLDKATHFLSDSVQANKILPLHTGKIVTTLFFEPSTRTLNSFQIAAQRLGALVCSPTLSESAINKGETLEDTIHTLEAMGANCFVIRHQDNGFADHVANIIHTETGIINAGDGMHQHPSQALLDLFTIKQSVSDLTNCRIAIIGDIKHSRVVGSLLPLLITMGVRDIQCISPQAWAQSDFTHTYISNTEDLTSGLTDADVIITLRIQKERLSTGDKVSESDYTNQYCLTPDRLAIAKPSAIVMHPGPMNHHIEIHPAVARCAQSKILDQVKNGVAMRMALLDTALN